MSRRIGLATTVVLLIGIVAGYVLLDRRLRKTEAEVTALREKASESEWNNYVANEMAGTDFLTPDVGTIQFLRKGYSIGFESVQYTQDGLSLSGELGNPTNLTVSNLALVFSARPYFTDDIKKKWEKMDHSFIWWPDEWNIGSGQTTVIPILLPRTRFPFTVTIPNVKQTKESFHIEVHFTGERYSY